MADGLALSLSRRQAEEALVASEMALKRSQILLSETEQVGKVGGWEFDIDSGKQSWTDEMYNILEVDSRYDPTLEKGLSFYTTESRPVIERVVQRTIEYGETFDEELEIITAGGRSRSIHVIGKADLENRRVYGFFQDITERKRAESYREMAREVLQILNKPGNLEDLVPQVLSTLKERTGFDAVGIRLQDGNDFPYFVQEGFPKDFLLVENSLIERSIDGGICRDIDGKVCLECTCGLVICGKTDPTNPLFTEGGSCWTNNSFPLLDLPPGADPRLHPRNECIHQGYASVALVPIRDSGNIVGLIQFNDRRNDCFTLDAVERLEEIASYLGTVLVRKRIEEERLTLQQQYQQTQKLESLGVLAGGIAHDFNNILAVIIGYCAIIKYDPVRPQDNIIHIEKAAERATELCRQMLAYAGKTQFIEARVEVAAIVDETVSMLKSGVSTDVTITCNTSENCPPIAADASQLRQLVKNLFVNSVEAIGEMSGKITVTLTKIISDEKNSAEDYFGKSIPVGTYLSLEITDTGCGMNEETKQRIFEPFFSTKFTGRGLGMSAVLGIINVHKGAVQLYSQEGQGTTVKFYLPVVQ